MKGVVIGQIFISERLIREKDAAKSFLTYTGDRKIKGFHEENSSTKAHQS